MGPQTKFWIKQGLGLAVFFAVPTFGAKFGVEPSLSFAAAVAAIISINLFLWPRIINGKVVSEDEWRGSLAVSFVLLAVFAAFALLIFWSIRHFEARRQSTAFNDQPDMSASIDGPHDEKGSGR